MLLSQIHADPSKYQHREKPFSEQTVAAILREGLNPAKFDPLPLVDAGYGRFLIGGDGHSRLEAVKRLAAERRLPLSWRAITAKPDQLDWDIPHKLVSEAEADQLSFTANLSRDDFAPTEEAQIYHRMLDNGMSLERIAALAHRSESYIRRMLPLNNLIDCIRERIGKSTDAGGIDKTVAMELAALVAQYDVGPREQQELYLRVLAHSEPTLSMVRTVVRSIFMRLKTTEEQGALFTIPPSVTQAVLVLKHRAQVLRRAISGLQALIGSAEVLESLPDLQRWLTENGEAALIQLRYESDSDGAVVGDLCLPSV